MQKLRAPGRATRWTAAGALACVIAASCASPPIESGIQQDGTPTPIPTVTESPVDSAPVDSAPAPTTTNAAQADPAPTTEPAPLPTVVPLTGWDAVDQYIDVTVIRGGSSSVSVAVMRDGAIEHVAAFGPRTSDDVARVGPNDRFRVASISKVITAITALQLVEEGLIGIDTPVGGTLAARLGVAEPADGVADITIRNLLTHRSGFSQYEDLFFRNQVDSCAAAATVGVTRALQGTPGDRFRYSNLNFCMLGLVIEEFSGENYESAVAAQLLDPLGISGMRLAGTFDVQDGDVEHVSTPDRNYMEVLGAAGAWIATPSEVAAIINSLDPSTPGWKPLGPTALELMKTVTTNPIEDPPVEDIADQEAGAPPPTTIPLVPVVPIVPDSGYGMGLMIFGPDTFGHTGTVESTHAMTVRRSDGLTWAITVSGGYPNSTRQLAVIMDNALTLGGFVTEPFKRPPAT